MSKLVNVIDKTKGVPDLERRQIPLDVDDSLSVMFTFQKKCSWCHCWMCSTGLVVLFWFSLGLIGRAVTGYQKERFAPYLFLGFDEGSAGRGGVTPIITLVLICLLTYQYLFYKVTLFPFVQMVLQFGDSCAGCNEELLQKSDMQHFVERFQLLNSDEKAIALMVKRSDFMSQVAQSITCVGCRRR